ncbi:MAG: ABC-2 family transporter protein [Candidatus Riflebacteria bacterium]|nr:ABC-2 family transporter protein [Candidatus Riflebacteria bacterium]
MLPAQGSKKKSKSETIISPWLVYNIFLHNLKSGMAYRISFLTQIIFMMLNNSFFLIFWYLFFAKFNDVRGWTLNDVIVLFAMGASSYGLAVMIFGNCMRLSTLIQEGQLDYYLLLPPDPLSHILISRMVFSGIGDFCFGILTLVLFTSFGLKEIAIFLLMTPISAIVYVSFCVIVHSLTFFMESSEGISRFLSEAMLMFSMYPEHLFDGMARFCLFTIVPVGFMTYLPVKVVQTFSLPLFMTISVVAVMMILLARVVFQIGLRAYESGNLISVRS